MRTMADENIRKPSQIHATHHDAHLPKMVSHNKEGSSWQYVVARVTPTCRSISRQSSTCSCYVCSFHWQNVPSRKAQRLQSDFSNKKFRSDNMLLNNNEKSMRPHSLSKSKLLAFRQCPKRLWLEIHRPTLRQDSAATQASFDVGHQVGDIARQLYDPNGKGQLIDPQGEGFAAAFTRSTELLSSSRPIFEAGFSAGGALAFADVLLPARKGGKRVWRMIEVKSSTSVKDYHRDDTAVQAFVARSAGVPLASIALAHIDTSWVYPGGDDYRGLLAENDLTIDAFGRENEVKGWIADAQAVARKRTEPKTGTGRHCGEPCVRLPRPLPKPGTTGRISRQLASACHVESIEGADRRQRRDRSARCSR
jgi:hypothetical protein